MLRRRLLITGFVAALALGSCGNAWAAKTVINFWMPFGGVLGAGMKTMVETYMKDHPDVDIKLMQVDNNLATSEKFIAAMAAGRPPEIMLVDGPQVIQWAARGLLTPLDTYLKSSAIKSTDFWTPSWKQTLWKGKCYAMPWISDANFPLLYNKTVFNECGIGSAPVTLEEMTAMTDKLNKVDSTGKYTRVGFLPWQTYGYSNSLFTFGWAFGGEFYDEAKDKVTCTDPKVVKSLEWMGDFARRFDYKKLTAFQSNWQWGGAKDPLVIAKVAMMPRVADTIRALDVAPKNFELGWSFVPGVAGGETKVAWLGGWTAGIPANAKNRDKTFAFLKWMCADAKGTRETFKQTGFTPSARNSLAFKDHDPKMTPWVETLKIANHQRPVMLTTPTYFAELDRVVPLVLEGKKSAAQVLTEANSNIQKELDKNLGRLSKRGK